MTETFNPTDVEQAIREVSDRIARGVKICAQRYSAFLAADREYDRLYAQAYVDAQGPQTEKRYRAEIVTTMQRKVRDEADAEYRYADRQAKALELELRAWQSVGASIRAMYQVAGRGEG